MVIRSYWRQRERLLGQRGEQIQLMQKALEQMNIQIHKVLSDVAGVSGLAIIRAILSGERDPKVLSGLLRASAKAKKGLVEKALEGRWADHHLFALADAVATYDFLDSRIELCEQRLDEEMSRLGGGQAGAPPPPHSSKNHPDFALAARLKDLMGVDATTIDGIEACTWATLVCEFGADLSRFKTEKHFCSYLGLSPVNKITGGKIKSSRTKKVAHRAATALRMAAQALHSSRSALGAAFRRLKARIGAAKAVTAIARKIAIQYYRLVVHGAAYVDVGEQAYNEKFNAQRLHSLQKQAARLGLKLVELHPNLEAGGFS